MHVANYILWKPRNIHNYWRKAQQHLGLATFLWLSLSVTDASENPLLEDGFVLEQKVDTPLVIYITSGRIEEALDNQTATVSQVARKPNEISPPAADLGELLDPIPSVFIGSRSNAAQDLRLSVRGFGSRGNFGIRGITVLFDGFPATLPDGQTSIDDIDPATIDRVEVRHGPAGSLFGPTAGGVLAYYPKPHFIPSQSLATLGYGSYDAWSAYISNNYASQTQSLQAVISTRSQSGFRDHASQLHRYFNLRGAHQQDSGGQFDFLLTAVDSPYAEDPGGLTTEERNLNRRAAGPLYLRFDTGEQVKQQRLGLRYKYPLSGQLNLKLSGYLISRDFMNRLPFSGTRLDREAAGVSLQFNKQSLLSVQRKNELSSLNWIAGLEISAQQDYRRRFENNDGLLGDLTVEQNEQATSLGLFGQLDMAVTDQWNIRLGLRADQVKFQLDDFFLSDGDQSGTRTFEQLSPSIGVHYRWSPKLSFYGRYGTAFETPTTTELASPSGSGGFNGVVEPQLAQGYEIGMRWYTPSGINAELALFDTHVEDQLVSQPIAGQPGRFYYINAASSIYKGIELSLHQSFGEKLDLTLSGSWAKYRFNRFQDADSNLFDGNRVPGIPEYQTAVILDYRPLQQLDVKLSGRYVGPRPVDNANSADSKSYGLVDFIGNWHVPGSQDRLHLSFGIENLFDAEYDDNIRINASGGRYYEPAAGRRFYINLALTLGDLTE